ncbi:MAG: type VI secretion protein IcmF/TssM N-terminal domain-containing protein [Phycisphaerales bacterium]
MATIRIKKGEIPPLTRMAAGGFTLAGVLAVGSLAFVTRPIGLFVLLGGALLVAGFSAFTWLFKKQTRAKQAARFTGVLSGAISSDRAEGMSRQELLTALNEGLETIRASRRSVYFRPWYLVVGPAGVGKTEAIRNSGVDLPKLRRDPLQGLGGTRTMHWWFANDAVIIDTAGRLFDAPDDSPLVDRWGDFLKLLRNARKECPINGLIVVISAEDLLREDWKAHASEKAPHFSRQLERIQRSLGRLRFPVYLMVTKCDLVPGFQSFMHEIKDRDLQQQIFGWSKPGEPDEPVSPDEAIKGIERLIDRVRRRRDLILPHTTGDLEADPFKNTRLDRVDELFVFPREFSRLVEPLRAYMDGMLQQDAWSSGQLYFRGVYFSTSLQDGRILDKALAKATGRALDDLPRIESEEESRPYFLRDLFLEKIFREQGLVSEADSLASQRRARATLVMGVGAAVFLVLAGLVATAWLRFDRSVGRHAAAWEAIASDVRIGGPVDTSFLIDSNDERFVRPDTIASDVASLRFIGSDDPTGGSGAGGAGVDRRAFAPVLASDEWSKKPISIPWEFGWVAPLFGGDATNLLAEERDATHRAIVEARVLKPMVHAAYRRAVDMAAGSFASDADADAVSGAETGAGTDARALGSLVALHTLAAEARPSGADGEAFVGTDIVGPLFAMVRIEAEAAPGGADGEGGADPNGDGAGLARAGDAQRAWENQIKPTLERIAIGVFWSEDGVRAIAAGSPLAEILKPDAPERRMANALGEDETIPNWRIIDAAERLIERSTRVGGTGEGDTGSVRSPLDELIESVVAYEDAERRCVAALRDLSAPSDAPSYEEFAAAWDRATGPLGAAHDRAVGPGSPWERLDPELRRALLEGDAEGVRAMVRSRGSATRRATPAGVRLLLDVLPDEPIDAAPTADSDADSRFIIDRIQEMIPRAAGSADGPDPELDAKLLALLESPVVGLGPRITLRRDALLGTARALGSAGGSRVPSDQSSGRMDVPGVLADLTPFFRRAAEAIESRRGGD